MTCGVLLIRSSGSELPRVLFGSQYDSIGLWFDTQGKKYVLLLDIFGNYIPKWTDYVLYEKIFIDQLVHIDYFDLPVDDSIFRLSLMELFVGSYISYSDIAKRVIESKDLPAIAMTNLFLSKCLPGTGLVDLESSVRMTGKAYGLSGVNLYNVFLAKLGQELLSYPRELIDRLVVNNEALQSVCPSNVYKEVLLHLIDNREVSVQHLNNLVPSLEEDLHLIIRANKYNITSLDFPLNKLDSVLKGIIDSVNKDSPVILDINDLIESTNNLGLDNKEFKQPFRKLCILESNCVTGKERIKLSSYIVIPDTKFNLKLFDAKELEIIWGQTKNEELKSEIKKELSQNR